MPSVKKQQISDTVVDGKRNDSAAESHRKKRNVRIQQRIDKLEENSRLDDMTIKEIVLKEESDRKRNIVELHAKEERDIIRLTDKIMDISERISRLEH